MKKGISFIALLIGFIGLTTVVSCEKKVISNGTIAGIDIDTDTDTQVANPLLSQIPGVWNGSDPDHTYIIQICSNGTFQYDRILNPGAPGGSSLNESGNWILDGNELHFTDDSTGNTRYFVIVNMVVGVSASFQMNGIFDPSVNHKTYTAPDPCLNPGGGGGTIPPTSVTDIDGNQYSVIQIGNQYWMGEDLEVTKFKDGTPLSQESWQNTSAWTSSSNPTYMVVDHSSAPFSSSSNGLAYNHVAGTSSHKLCPDGFRVPLKQDFEILIANYSDPIIASNALKSTSSWVSYFIGAGSASPPNLLYANGNNSSGFNAKPTGRMVSGTSPTYDGNEGYWLVDGPSGVDYRFQITGHDWFTGDISPAVISNGDNTYRKCRCIYD